VPKIPAEDHYFQVNSFKQPGLNLKLPRKTALQSPVHDHERLQTNIKTERCGTVEKQCINSKRLSDPHLLLSGIVGNDSTCGSETIR
jgi:hypothetical protein